MENIIKKIINYNKIIFKKILINYLNYKISIFNFKLEILFNVNLIKIYVNEIKFFIHTKVIDFKKITIKYNFKSKKIDIIIDSVNTNLTDILLIKFLNYIKFDYNSSESIYSINIQITNIKFLLNNYIKLSFNKFIFNIFNNTYQIFIKNIILNIFIKKIVEINTIKLFHKNLSIKNIKINVYKTIGFKLFKLFKYYTKNKNKLNHKNINLNKYKLSIKKKYIQTKIDTYNICKNTILNNKILNNFPDNLSDSFLISKSINKNITDNLIPYLKTNYLTSIISNIKLCVIIDNLKFCFIKINNNVNIKNIKFNYTNKKLYELQIKNICIVNKNNYNILLNKYKNLNKNLFNLLFNNNTIHLNLLTFYLNFDNSTFTELFNIINKNYCDINKLFKTTNQKFINYVSLNSFNIIITYLPKNINNFNKIYKLINYYKIKINIPQIRIYHPIDTNNIIEYICDKILKDIKNNQINTIAKNIIFKNKFVKKKIIIELINYYIIYLYNFINTN